MESGAVTHRAWLVRTNWSSQNCRVGLELDLECREVSEPTVIAVFRPTIESDRALVRIQLAKWTDVGMAVRAT